MENIRIGTVVTGKTLNEFLNNLEKTQEIADFVELRLDYINDFSIKDITIIREKTKRKAIFTCRKKSEGGFYNESENERIEILERAHTMGFDYIDIELSSANQFSFKKNQTKIILSFHDFKKTPKLETLEKIKQRMKIFPTGIMKFSTFIQKEEEEKTLLKFLLNKQKDEEMIIIGMGEKGKIIRVFSPLLGSYLTFASTDYSQSAPGQLKIEELKNIYKFLN